MNGILQKEPTEACRKEKGRMQNTELSGGWSSGGRWQGPVPEATEADEGDQVCRFRSIKMIRSHPIISDQIKPNPTKKSGPARIKAKAVGSKLARTNLDFGRARWMRRNAERMNGKAEGLGDRNTYNIYETDEHGSGLEENLHLSSLILAYLRLSSLNGRKMFDGRP
jgi:hypothetical protein